MSIEQSGNVTSGHLATWITNGVVGDGGSPIGSAFVLASLLSADFNTTADQPIALPSTVNYFALTGIIIAAASTSLTTAAGGFYPTTSKGGSAIVSSAQAYSALTANTLLMNATLTAYAQAQFFSRTQLADWAIYLSLTTPQGSDALANIYLLGTVLG